MRHGATATLKRTAVLVLALWLAGAGGASACQVPGARNAAQTEIIARTNAYRKASRRAAVIHSQALAAAAQKQACDMAAAGAISHTGADGSSVSQRVSSEGYAWRFVAENVAAGYPTGAAVFAGWKGSRGHRANMLNRRADEIGIGWATAGGKNYWVMVLAAPR